MSGSANLYSGTGIQGRRGGVVSASIDGETVDVAGEPTYQVWNVKREMYEGLSSVQGYKETPTACMIGFTIRDARNFSVAGLQAKTNSTVVLVLASGKTITGDGMVCVEADEVNAEEATFKVVFKGLSVVET